MRFHILTLFPGMFDSPFAESIVGRARKKGLVDLQVYNFRDYAKDRHRTVDDYLFGGGRGMLMKPEPLFEAVESIRAAAPLEDSSPVILMSPQGRTLTQTVVEDLVRHRDLLC